MFDGVVPRIAVGPAWRAASCANTERLLGHLRRARASQATFFVLGWVAERHPGARAADRGARPRDRVARLRAPARLRPDAGGVPRGRAAREGAARGRRRARRCVGYRAPSYSITPRSLWALDVLIEEGYRYDASIFPIRHDRYGIPDVAAPCRTGSSATGGTLVEVPASTVRVRADESAGRRRRLLPAPAVLRGRAGASAASTGASAGRRSSTCTRGRSIRSSRGSAPAQSARSGTTATSIAPKAGCGAC